MPPGRHAFLAGLIDYAGLFPPAALELAPAVENYAAYRAGDDSWMLGRFIVPAARLADLDAHADAFAGDDPWRFSVLGHAPAEGEAWADALRRTVADARAFDERHDGQTACDRFEVRLPADLAHRAALPDTLVGLDDVLGARTAVAVEVPLLAHPDTVAPAARAVASANATLGRPAFAVKLRCGGETPDTIPSVDALADALAAVADADAPFKATAGLHHPFRHDDAVVGAPMHGFVNVFGAAVLARLHGLGQDAIAEALSDADASHWTLGETLGWRSLSATAAETADARAHAALSFGSCSFDEPREDLRALGWL